MLPAGGVRSDLQALRGFAVLLVIAYHLAPSAVPGGFLGVDVFFVLSGYLIGGMVMRDTDQRRFSLPHFYLRRIRRLAPAAMAMLLVVIVLAVWLLTPDAQRRFVPQALGTLVGATNLVLWQQINYFNNAAASEPLLHMWSLGIEEQFYLLFPPLLCVLPVKARGSFLALTTAASLGLYLMLSQRSPGFTFYLLPTRAWELSLGAGAAWLEMQRCTYGVGAAFKWPALAVLLTLPLLRGDMLRPDLAILPACLATAVLVRKGGALPSPSLFERVGNASYSLYLVHWPVLAFGHILWVGAPVPLWGCAIMLGAILTLGILLYVGIERPCHRYDGPAIRILTTWLGGGLVLAVLTLAGPWIVRSRGEPVDLSGVTGLTVQGCGGNPSTFDGRCANSAAPQMLIWGDSFSQHLIPALLASGAPGLAQASKGQCPPLPGLAPLDRDAPEPYARNCLSFQHSVLSYLQAQPGIRVVVMSGFDQRFAQPGTRALRDNGHRDPADMEEILAVQARTTAAIRAMGKRVIVVSGPPQADFDPGQCQQRQRLGLPAFLPARDCAITPDHLAPSTQWLNGLLAALPLRSGTPVLRLDQILCSGGRHCATQLNDEPLYRDASHFSRAGSMLMGRRLGLSRLLLDEAR